MGLIDAGFMASATPHLAQTEAVTDDDLGRGEAMLFLAGHGVDDRNGYTTSCPTTPIANGSSAPG